MRDSFDNPADIVYYRRLRGLLRLAQSNVEAKVMQTDKWQYAVPIVVLRDHSGLTNADLRWLVQETFAEHRLETTTAGARRRTFRNAGILRPSARVCLVASDAGMRLARQLCEIVGDFGAAPLAVKPHWDRRSGLLTLNGALVKRLPARADAQRKVLDRCDESHWVEDIQSPFTDIAPLERSHYLCRVLDHLNNGQKDARIHFSARDKGTRLTWAPLPRR